MAFCECSVLMSVTVTYGADVDSIEPVCSDSEFPVVRSTGDPLEQEGVLCAAGLYHQCIHPSYNFKDTSFAQLLAAPESSVEYRYCKEHKPPQDGGRPLCCGICVRAQGC